MEPCHLYNSPRCLGHESYYTKDAQVYVLLAEKCSDLSIQNIILKDDIHTIDFYSPVHRYKRITIKST